MQPLLYVERLRKEFDGFVALDECSFSVERGSITGLIGPNGAGKTTTFDLIAGRIRPTSGTVRFESADITGLSADALFARGIVRTFQIPQEFHGLSVIENLMMVAPGQDGESLLANWFTPGRVRAREAAVRRRAEDTIAFLELGPVTHERAGLISGGQKKLLELGRTMMTDAKLVLLDEPAAGVNRTLLRKLEDKIQVLNRQRGYTFVLIEHDMDMIDKLCGKVVCMAEGRVLVEGSFDRVRSDPRVLEAYLGERVPDASAES